ncbi:hypothetical protein, partial [Nocardia sp. NPDC003354]
TAASEPPGSLADGPAVAGRETVHRLGQVFATHYRVAAATASAVEELNPDDRQRFREAHSALIVEQLGSIDAAQAGRAVTDLSIGTNALRDAAAAFRRAFDELIADYLTTGRYHESHEAFVTTSILLEEWLYAMADATTEQHDVLDDAVSSNTRIVANVGRGLAYYGERIARLPESSYDNIARVLHEHAEPQQYGRIVNALLDMHNRVAAADPTVLPEVYRRFLSSLDPAVVHTAARSTVAAVDAGLRANPALLGAVLRACGALCWTVLASIPKHLLRGRK